MYAEEGLGSTVHSKNEATIFPSWGSESFNSIEHRRLHCYRYSYSL